MEGMMGAGAAGLPEDLDEKALLVGLRAGDEQSFEWMVRKWCGRMVAVARRLLGIAGEAYDCVQEAFLQAFQYLGTFEGRSSLGTWLHRITVNDAWQSLRAHRRHPEESPDGLLPRFDASGHRVGPPRRIPRRTSQGCCRLLVVLHRGLDGGNDGPLAVRSYLQRNLHAFLQIVDRDLAVAHEKVGIAGERDGF